MRILSETSANLFKTLIPILIQKIELERDSFSFILGQEVAKEIVLVLDISIKSMNSILEKINNGFNEETFLTINTSEFRFFLNSVEQFKSDSLDKARLIELKFNASHMSYIDFYQNLYGTIEAIDESFQEIISLRYPEVEN